MALRLVEIVPEVQELDGLFADVKLDVKMT